MNSYSELLGPDGPLARHIPGFAPRAQQQEMAEAVGAALEDCSILVAEAGTGTGKTYAYLAPALLSGQKVIISTGTKTLQDQLYHRDLPLVRDALGAPVKIALLKGRSNYLCRHRLEVSEQGGRLRTRADVQDLAAVGSWARVTATGDIAEARGVPEDAAVWPLVTSTADNCLGQDCPAYGDCHLVQARRRAQEADIVVVNHHLFFADLALRDEGVGELLPGADAVIFDEAHQLPDVASDFFGIALSSGQLAELAADTQAEQLKEAPDMAGLRALADRVQTTARDLRLAFGEATERRDWHDRPPGFEPALAALNEALSELADGLEHAAVRGRGLDGCRRRCEELQARLHLLSGPAPEDHVRWLETYTRAFALHLTPLDVSEIFQRFLHAQRRAWIFTSATLAVRGRFEHFTGQLGLDGAITRCWDSPFDYARQALLYLPKDLPDPSNPAYTPAVVELARPIIEASRGRTFVLCTSHRALRRVAESLQDLEYPLLVQGTQPRARLLADFRSLGNAVLVGTSSFWEGVDVRGEALSCVIIDKLPFAAPDDPVLRARNEALRARGGDPFFEHQLPSAVITLKQGVGRLIRDVSDRGVMVICDPRLVTRSYGRVFLQSLPPMPRTRDIDDVIRFFQSPIVPAVAEPIG